MIAVQMADGSHHRELGQLSLTIVGVSLTSFGLQACCCWQSHVVCHI